MGGFLSAAVSKLLGGGPIIESECSNIRCCSTSQARNVYDPRLGTMPTGWDRGTSEGSTASEISRTPFRFRRKKQAMTTIYVDSRKRVSGSDSNFAFELPETLHMQSSAKMAVYKVRIADAFLSTDGPESLLDRPGPGHLKHR